LEIEKKYSLLLEENERLNSKLAELEGKFVNLNSNFIKLKNQIDNASEGIFQTSVDVTYINVNNALAKLYGYDSPEEFMHDRNNISEQSYLNSSQREAFVSLMERDGYVKGFEYQVKKKDGSIIWFYEDARAIKDDKGDTDYYEGFVVDITQRRQIENERDLTLTRLEKLLDHSDQGVLFENFNSEIEYANNKFCKLFGIPDPKIFLGMICTDLAEQSKQYFKSPDEFINRINFILENNEIVLNDVLYLADGRVFERDYIPIFLEDNEKESYWLYRDVTERKALEQKIKNEEEKFRLIAENTSDGILLINNKSEIEYVSPSYYHQLGFGINDGRPVFDDKDIYNLIHPDDRDELFAQIFDGISQKVDSLKYQYRAKNKDDIYIWREDNTRFIYDNDGNYLKSYVVSRDISERKQFEEEIKLLSKTIEQSPLLVYITDVFGNISYINDNVISVTGYSKSELLGNNPSILKSNLQENFFYNNLWETIKSGHNWTGDFVNRKKNGDLYWQHSLISPILDSKSNITHFVAICEDITAQKKVEKELIDAKQKAEESDKLKTAFLQNISHEIRTPLNGIIGFSNLLNMGGNTEDDIKEITSLIQSSGQRLIEIVNNIIDISRIETGQISITNKLFNLNNTMDDLFVKFKSEAEQKNIKLFYKKHKSDSQSNIDCDEDKLNNIFSNLLKNAIKFSETGFIRFGYYFKKNKLYCYVRDTGLGIPEEKKHHIFQKFVQVDYSTSRRFEGAGLGLVICKGYVDKFGGNISYKSKVGKFTIFNFSIPIKRILPVVSKVKDQPEFNNSKCSKILVAEDNVSNLFIYKRILEKNGFETLEAQDGQEAIDMVKNNSDIKIILMDISMPKVDGLTATKQIKEFNPNIYIIVQTAYNIDDFSFNNKEIFYDDFITKPIDYLLLIQKIKSILSFSN